VDYPLTATSDNWGSLGFWPSNASNFRCDAESNVYQWGFSFEWLFMTAVINSVWLTCLWIVWVDCDTNSELCKKRRRLGLWRAIADISEAMREELGPNLCAYSEEELAGALQKRPPIMYTAIVGDGDDVGHIRLSSEKAGKLRLLWDREYGSKIG